MALIYGTLFSSQIDCVTTELWFFENQLDLCPKSPRFVTFWSNLTQFGYKICHPCFIVCLWRGFTHEHESDFTYTRHHAVMSQICHCRVQLRNPLIRHISPYKLKMISQGGNLLEFSSTYERKLCLVGPIRILSILLSMCRFEQSIGRLLIVDPRFFTTYRVSRPRRDMCRSSTAWVEFISYI